MTAAAPSEADCRAWTGAHHTSALALWAAPPIAVAVACWGGAPFGIHLKPVVIGLLVAGAYACLRWPHRRLALTAATGFLALAVSNPTFAVYHALTVAALFSLRRSPGRMLAFAALACLVVPKTLFREHYHQPGFYNWLSAPSLALTFFVTLYLWRQRRDDRAPRLEAQDELAAWAALYWLPGHAANPMVFGPADLWQKPSYDVRALAHVMLRLLLKGLLMWLWLRGSSTWSYATLAARGWQELGRAQLWMFLGWNYGATLLQLAGTAEVAVLLARVYGFALPPPFRWAFLAWNPVELWRRWGIYNRRILLSLVYFPLGGSRHRRWRNVVLTFLASALILHSGWFGSIYWSVGTGGWRDETIYFAMQGLAVCACLLWWQRRGGDAPTERSLKATPGRAIATLATQAFSAWVHVIILLQGLPLGERFRLMWSCLGG